MKTKTKSLFLIASLVTIIFFNTAAFSQTGWFTQYGINPAPFNAVYFINQHTGWILGISGCIEKTTNGGLNWFSQNTYDDFFAMDMVDQNTGWVVGSVVLKTTNGGENWVYQPSGIHNWLISVCFLDYNTGWIASGSDGEIIITTNGGLNWTSQYYHYNQFINDVIFINAYTGWFAAGDGISHDYIYNTIDGGSNWSIQYTGTGFIDINSITFINQNTGFAVGYGGQVLKTTNSGLNWNSQNSGTNLSLYSVSFVSASSGWACSEGGMVIKTTNGGANWTNQIITNHSLASIYFVNENTGWVVGGDSTIWKTTNGGTPIGIEPISGAIPKCFSLQQNYPNPFNPVTKIKFDVSSDSRLRGNGNVTLKVYDVLGREVAVLVNQQLTPGTYEVTWDASNYPSGLYFYVLESDNYFSTKKMVLIK